jgi:hypothetical protein
VTILKHNATPEIRDLFKKLAADAPEAGLMQQANAGVERLASRRRMTKSRIALSAALAAVY